jgi:hypothetical protein
MIQINIKNIEELIFKNNQAKGLLPELRHIFDQWFLSYRIPALNTMRKQAKIDLLNSLNGEQIEKLARLFDDLVFVDKLDYHVVKNLSFPIDSPIERELTNYESYSNIAISRNEDQLYITMWR